MHRNSHVGRGEKSLSPRQRSGRGKIAQPDQVRLSSKGNAKRNLSVKGRGSERPSKSTASLLEIGKPFGSSVLVKAAVAALPKVLASRATGSLRSSSVCRPSKASNTPKARPKREGAKKKSNTTYASSLSSALTKSKTNRPPTKKAMSKAPSSTRGVGSSAGKTEATRRRPPSKAVSRSNSTKTTRTGQLASGKVNRRSAQGRFTESSRPRGKRISFGNSLPQRWVAQQEILQEDESSMRQALIAEEELERYSFTPIYNAIVMKMVRTCVEQINRQQRVLCDAFEQLRLDGVVIGNEDNINVVVEKIRSKMGNFDVDELYRLRAENTSLREQLETKTRNLDFKTAELECLRQNAICTVAQKMARLSVDTEQLKTHVEAVLRTATLEVARMRKDLFQRIDVATAHLRTPQYGSSLQSLRALVEETQKEIQQHHDTLASLITSIEAKDNFVKYVSATMHSNIPPEYRQKLRQMSNDRLINIFDVLSFHDGVVGCLGKVLYALQTHEHQTAVI